MPDEEPFLSSTTTLPVLPLRDVVVFPHMVIPLFVGRDKSTESLEFAMRSDKRIMLITQKKADVDDPSPEDVHEIGTIANILQLLKLPDGTVKVLIEGVKRAEISEFTSTKTHFTAKVKEIVAEDCDTKKQEALCRSVISQFEQYVKTSKKTPVEVLSAVSSITECNRLADTIAAHLSIDLEEKQKILAITNYEPRMEHLLSVIEFELDLMQVEKRMRNRVMRQMEKSQREYYLNEQMKAIQKELGEIDDSNNEIENLTNKINAAGMPKDALDKALSEVRKLKMMSPMSAEATVIRNYIDCMVAVPWKKRGKIHRNLTKAQATLDKEHYGLEKVKERILEYLAVQQRVKVLKAPILCLVGPPGVGKTSLGRSIAHATNRKFIKMPLGGVRDEAEIRGHRRTYIGSMPGKIIQSLSKSGVKNPLFVLDEIDKMSNDFRGDPASALLEVLDPEQNHAFGDHFLEVDYDLSEVMFIATANTLNIPAPLLDRMEVIQLSGYTEDEKLSIAKQYLIPKAIKNNGLKEKEIEIDDTAVTDIIRYYTREAGVRNTEREISKICRKVVKQHLLENDSDCSVVSTDNIEKYLGVKKFRFGLADENDRIGQVTGLAWTEVGGELLTIESVIVPGKGNLIKTGKLGDVMQESITAAMSVVRSRAESLGIDPAFHLENDFHIHVPEGGIPKDGPSAGAAMCTALVSALTETPVRASVAMTGEITLRGEILSIGGLKEKLLAALRGGIKTVLIPSGNTKDLAEIPSNILEQLEIKPVTWVDEVLSVALCELPAPEDQHSNSGSTNPSDHSEVKPVAQPH